MKPKEIFMRTLFVNAGKRESWQEEISDERIKGILDLGVHLHLERYRSYEASIFDERNVVVFGTGNLNYGGTNRGVFVFRSPLSGALHSSTLGDLGEYLKRAGFQALVIEGKSESPLFLTIKNEEVQFLDENIPENIFEKERELYEKISGFYGDTPFRVVLAGKGGEKTFYGCIVSSKRNKIGTMPDVAGRGGAGSVLIRAHNVIGFSLGGTKPFDIQAERNLVKEQVEATKKYREKGTFLANYPHLQENTIIMNWQSLFLSKEERKEIFERFVVGELLKGYRFSSTTCGEKCVAICKKIEEEVKLDYEPIQGLGPFIGVFSRDKIRELIYLVDSLGLDAIYLGNVLTIVFEALYRGNVSSEIFGLKEIPSFDPKSPNSEKNYELAKTLITRIVSQNSLLGNNIRKIAKELGVKDLALYVPLGEQFDMVPNFYWSLGLILPIVMHGKYFSDYHIIFKEPEEYAKVCAERTIKEYALDNLGICRFHRGWIEGRLNKWIPNYLENCKYWIRRLLEYREKANALPQFWESKRAKEIAKKLIEEFGNDEWKEKVKNEEGLREYWERWYRTYVKEFE
jgi:glyceraldehyde-3-phosphate dehydrogenase (ferredoxin)